MSRRFGSSAIATRPHAIAYSTHGWRFWRGCTARERDGGAGRGALDVHLTVDNYATHRHPKVRAWLERHPRFHVRSTPTWASWINAAEGLFAELT
jgi:hypothetical protein